MALVPRSLSKEIFLGPSGRYYQFLDIRALEVGDRVLIPDGGDWQGSALINKEVVIESFNFDKTVAFFLLEEGAARKHFNSNYPAAHPRYDLKPVMHEGKHLAVPIKSFFTPGYHQTHLQKWDQVEYPRIRAFLQRTMRVWPFGYSLAATFNSEKEEYQLYWEADLHKSVGLFH